MTLYSLHATPTHIDTYPYEPRELYHEYHHNCYYRNEFQLY